MKLITRAQWGARAPRGTTPIRDIRGLTVHWEGPRMGAFSHDKCDDKIRGIQDFHMGTRGWSDIAYNYLVCPHGYVYQGRGKMTRSAANGTNYGNDFYLAVCYLGGEGDPFTAPAKTAILELKKWLGLTKMNAHRDHKATACPGDIIYRWVSSNPQLPVAQSTSPTTPEPTTTAPPTPEEEPMKLYIVKDPNGDHQYITNGITKWHVPKPEHIGEADAAFDLTRITLSAGLLAAIPTVTP